MKLRVAVSVLALAAAPLTACSSSGGGGAPSSVGGSVSVSAGGVTVTGGASVAISGGGGASGEFCQKLTTANSKLSDLPSSASGGDFGALKSAIEEDISAFQELSAGAPSDVKPSIDDVVSLLQSAEQAVSDPAHPDVAKLQGLATKLPTDLTALGNYLANSCGG
jgi:hypothetical protein